MCGVAAAAARAMSLGVDGGACFAWRAGVFRPCSSIVKNACPHLAASLSTLPFAVEFEAVKVFYVLFNQF